MNSVKELLGRNAQVSDYKINIRQKESFELFYVKGKLETARCTDTCDRQVTVYVDHDGYKGDSTFFVYPSDGEKQIEAKIATAVQNAQLINNQPYTLPGNETGEYQLDSNLNTEDMPALADKIAQTVFKANTVENGSLNSVEVFINRYTHTVTNSRGLHKTQHRYDAMVEAIPTFNGPQQSVELYEQYNFGSLDAALLTAEIAGKMQEVEARCKAVKPEQPLDCKVVLHKQDIAELFWSIAGDLNYSTVYSHSNLFHKGDKLQKEPSGDSITIRMKGRAEGNINSSCFDGDGLSLNDITLVEQGIVENYYGSNRFGQYLGEQPTGMLGCLCVESGTAKPADLEGQPWLEVVSMSGLQVDFFNDYIGGEIRLAYYHDGNELRPVTGISISGKLNEVLNQIALSEEITIQDGYSGPASAILSGMKIF